MKTLRKQTEDSVVRGIARDSHQRPKDVFLHPQHLSLAGTPDPRRGLGGAAIGASCGASYAPLPHRGHGGAPPDHLHTVWTLPPEDAEYAIRWSLLKGHFQAVRHLLRASQSASRHDRREICLWQRRFWEHGIRDNADYARHIDYVHYNPVKHGLVAEVCEWPYSTFHRFVRMGLSPGDSAGNAQEPTESGDGDFGE